MFALLSFAVFMFGACVGSFLNCVIYRLETKDSFWRGRSFCPKCKQGLKWYDLTPVLSFLFLGGRCRHCKEKISWQYPAVEMAAGLLSFLIFYFFFLNRAPFNEQTLSYGANPLFFISYFLIFVIGCYLIVIFLYDLKHFIIPEKVVYPAIGTVFVYKIIFNFQAGGFYSAIISAFASSGFFFLIWLASRGRWLGFGDVPLVFLLGLFLGFPNILVALFFAFFIGAIIGLGLIILGKKRLKSEVPFGPFLITGTFIALFWGEKITEWYLGLG